LGSSCKEHRAALPHSSAFFEMNFPDLKWDELKLLPKLNLKFPKPKTPIQFLSERTKYSSDIE